MKENNRVGVLFPIAATFTKKHPIFQVLWIAHNNISLFVKKRALPVGRIAHLVFILCIGDRQRIQSTLFLITMTLNYAGYSIIYKI